MKHRPKDLHDTLATGVDKVELVNELKQEIRSAGYGIKVKRRKLASGEKLYFTITIPEEEFWTIHTRSSVVTLMQRYFPEASITSANSSEVTYSEY